MVNEERQARLLTPTSRNNSIAFLRFILAILVLFSHNYVLGGFGRDPLQVFSHGQQTFGGVAVAGFFFLSGFLITQSYQRSRSIWRFLWHRVLRIFPGFWVCLFITAFVFAPLVCLLENGSLTAYLHAGTDGPIQYLTSDVSLAMQQFGIAGLLVQIPYPGAFDGSLWSLQVEFTCYVALGILGILGIVTRYRFIMAGLTLCVWTVAITPHIVQSIQPLALLLVIFGRGPVFQPVVYFFVGALCFLFRDKVTLHWAVFVIASLIILVTLAIGGSGIVFPLAVPYVLLWLAFRLPIRNFDRHGDLSYGVYIYAFPVQQLLATLQIYRDGLPLFLGLTCALTIPLAMLSWRLVEQPCLRFKGAQLPRRTAIAARWIHQQ